jgi:WD40 repeat protein
LRTNDAQKRIFESDGWSLAIAYSSDGKLLAHATSTGEISLWQIAAENCLLKLKTEWQMEQLSFSPDNRSLMTDHGRLIPDCWPSNIGSQNDGVQNNDDQNEPSNAPFAIQGYGIGFHGTWLTKDGERIVWLPPEHRPSSNALVTDSVVVIRNSSDQLLMFGFDD